MAKATKTKSQLQMDQDALLAKIKAFGVTLKSIQNDAHDIAARIVVHAVRYNDVSLATKFLEKFGTDGKTMVRANMFKAWFEKHGPFRWDKESKGFKCMVEKATALKAKHLKDNKTTAKFFGLLKKATPWEKDPEPEYKGFDLDKEVARLLSRAKKAEKEHGKDPKTNVKNLDKLEKLVHALNYPANEDNDNTETKAA